MTRNPTPTLAFAALAVILTFAYPAPAVAEDFNFRIPLEVVSFAPGVTDVNLNVGCYVSRALSPTGYPSATISNLVAQDSVRVVLGPGPVSRSQVVTVAINALSPRTRPASEGRYYACAIEQVNLTFPEGDTLTLSGNVGSLEPNYATATGHRLTTVVTSVHGELPH